MRPIHNNLAFGESPITATTPQAAVADNMYKVFWFAQGEPTLDRNLSNLIENQYAHQWSDEDWQTARAHVGDMDDPVFLQLGLPRRHVDPRARGEGGAKQGDYAQTINEEFELRWRGLGYIFNRERSEVARVREEEREESLRTIEGRMIYCDHRYNTDGRRRRFSTDDDPHQSMYRTFVLEGRPTGSEELDVIFGELRERFIENGPPEGEFKLKDGTVANYESMVTSWQANHPGESFEPADHDIRSGVLRGQIRERSKSMATISSIPLNGLILALKDRLTRK